jgi:hypothetical protein
MVMSERVRANAMRVEAAQRYEPVRVWGRTYRPNGAREVLRRLLQIQAGRLSPVERVTV